jgi:hypothetical protein
LSLILGSIFGRDLFQIFVAIRAYFGCVESGDSLQVVNAGI